MKHETQRTARTSHGLLLATLIAAIGCGGGSAETETPAETEEATTETSGGETSTEAAGTETVAVAFDDLSREEQFAFMRNTVMPEMTAMFQEFDAERYADFSCFTCHGDNAEEVGFEMPNGIAPLNPEHIPAMFESERPMAVFMTQRVWPRMTEMLGEAPYNPETHEGFGCLGCHGMEGG